ncbi:LsmAD domain-containing protein [Besnoitia besnoiti]|uniref:LsmAD domain-containing protein n=1 Tax=Besnoitia besnoiti TaxID=94643 RepID=A0A2A9MQ80_BESBE|nr:LsmAD domain-containing protein [Besnoitia besnoiti]PFH38646.1 LsmAD domain-containing protein [Besnoitia besnoiti]
MGKPEPQPPAAGAGAGGLRSERGGRKSPSVAEINEMRMNYCMAVLTGREVRVKLENGGQVQGLFHAYEKKERKDGPEGDLVLSCARELPTANRLSGEVKRQLHLPDRSFLSLHAYDVPLAPAAPATGPAGASGSSSVFSTPAAFASGAGGFQTDTQISSHGGGKRFMERGLGHGPSGGGRGGAGYPRELQKWVADGAGSSRGDDALGALEPSGGLGGRRLSGSAGTEWDQFAVNEQRFGVRSSYKEELYTTKLDLDAIPLQVQQQADRLATEMEKQQQGARDAAVDDVRGGEDEEALFSAVTGTGGYAQHRRSPGGSGGGVLRASPPPPDSAGGGGGRGSTRSSVASNSPHAAGGPSGLGNKSGAASGSGAGAAPAGERGGDRRASSFASLPAQNSTGQRGDTSRASGSAGSPGGKGASGGGISGHVAKVAGGALRELRENLEIAAKENQRKELARGHAPAAGGLPGPRGAGVTSTPPAHKELHETHKKMRSILASGSPGRAPALHELGGINALNLEPALPKLDDQTQEEWLNFKNKKTQQAQPGGGETKRRDRAQDKNEFLNASKVFTQLLEKNKSPGSARGSGNSTSGGPSHDTSPAGAASSAQNSSQSSSTFGTKKGFQFNPHANAFTPSTPSHTNPAALRGPHGAAGAAALHANAYGAHRPHPGVPGAPGMMTGLPPQLGPGGMVGVPGAAGGPPAGRVMGPSPASAIPVVGLPGAGGVRAGDPPHMHTSLPHANAAGARHHPHHAATVDGTGTSAVHGKGHLGAGSAGGPNGLGGPQIAGAGVPGVPGATGGAVAPHGGNTGGANAGATGAGARGHPQGATGGNPNHGAPQHLNPAGGMALTQTPPGGCAPPPAHPFAGQPGGPPPHAAGCWPGGMGAGASNEGLVAGVVVAGGTGTAGGLPPPQHPQAPGGVAGPHPNHAAGGTPGGAAATGLMGPAGGAGDPQNPGAAGMAAGALQGGGMMATAGPGGASVIPDGLAAGAMPFGMGGFAINSHMAQMNMMGGNLIGQPPPPPSQQGHQRQHPHHQQGLIGSANMRMGPGGTVAPHPHGGGHPNGNGAPHFAPFQRLSASKGGKGGRGSSGMQRNRDVGEFVNSLINKARHEKLSQVSSEWIGLGTDSYRMILGQIPPTSFPPAAALPAAALSAPIAPFPILHPQLSAPLPASPLFSLHPRLLFPAGPQAFLPAAGAPPHPGAMSYPLMYPPLPLAQHLSPLVSNPAAAAAVAAAAAAAAAHQQGHASHPGGGAGAQAPLAPGAPGQAAGALPNAPNQTGGVVGAAGALGPPALPAGNGAAAGAPGAGFQQSQLLVQQQVPSGGGVQPHQRGVGAVAGVPCTLQAPQGQPQSGQQPQQTIVGLAAGAAMGQPLAAQTGPANFAAMAAALGHPHFPGAAAGGGVMGAAHAVPYVPQPLAGLAAAGRPLAYAPMMAAGAQQPGLLHGFGAPQQAIMPVPPLLATPAATAGVAHPSQGTRGASGAQTGPAEASAAPQTPGGSSGGGDTAPAAGVGTQGAASGGSQGAGGDAGPGGAGSSGENGSTATGASGGGGPGSETGGGSGNSSGGGNAAD